MYYFFKLAYIKFHTQNLFLIWWNSEYQPKFIISFSCRSKCPEYYLSLVCKEWKTEFWWLHFHSNTLAFHYVGFLIIDKTILFSKKNQGWTIITRKLTRKSGSECQRVTKICFRLGSTNEGLFFHFLMTLVRWSRTPFAITSFESFSINLQFVKKCI